MQGVLGLGAAAGLGMAVLVAVGEVIDRWIETICHLRLKNVLYAGGGGRSLSWLRKHRERNFNQTGWPQFS